MKLFPALLIGMRLNWSLGRLNRIERRMAREIKEYQPNSDSTTHDGSATDIGVLSSEEYEDDTLLFDEERLLKSNSQSPVCNPKQIVKCDNGYNVDNRTQTCQDACEGDCCSGEDFFPGRNPCFGFTGSVCKDGISCSGKGACIGANITSVVRSCYGPFACSSAGKTNGGTGYVGEVIDSCQGEDACIEMAENGFIKSIVNSCQGKRSCYNAAQYGYIGSIIDSCHGLLSCRTTANDGTISSILKSCNGTYSCRSAAFQGSIEGGIVRSCNADQACRQAAISGSIAAITKSCNGEDACRDAAREGTIGGVGILKACNAEDACVGLAKINTTKAYNCTEGEQQVAPYCPLDCSGTQYAPYCPTAEKDCIEECTNAPDFQFCFFECKYTPAYNCTEGAQQVAPNCPLDCSGTQYAPYCPLLSDRTYNITSGLEKCCNEAESCKNIGGDLPDDCIEKKNVVPWQKGKKDKGRE